MDNDSRYAAALLTIPFFIVLITALFFLNIGAVFEPPYLLFIFNTVFLGLIPLYIACILFRTYRKSGNLLLSILGAGMLIMGICSIVAGWTVDLPDGPNITVTIHNTAFLAGAALSFLASIENIDVRIPGIRRVRPVNGTILYGVASLFAVLLIAAALTGLLPPFFTPEGPTVLRQAILIGSIWLFATAAVHFSVIARGRQTFFFRWYALALALIAIGLGAVMLQPSVGSAIGWAGRAAQYLGACLALVAILSVRKTATEQGVAAEDLLSLLFSEAETGYRNLIETAADAIVVFDPEYRIILWNPAAEKLFGYQQAEVRGKLFTGLGLTPSNVVALKDDVMRSGTNGYNPFDRTPIETEIRQRAGSRIPVEMTLSRHQAEGVWMTTAIIRDLSERTRAEESVRRRQAETQALFDTIPAGLVLFGTGPSYEVLIHNRCYQEFFAEPFRSQGMEGLSIYDYAPEVEAAGVVAIFDEVFRTRQPKHFLDFPYSSNPQYETWFNWYLSPIIIDDRVVALVSMSLDVTDYHNAETALRYSEEQLRKDLESVRMLQNIGTIYLHEGNLETVLTDIVDAAIAITHADFGNIQLADPETGDLRIAAQRGFPDWWLEYWNTVSRGKGSCGTAVERGERIVVEDVEQSPIFAGSPALGIQQRAGIRAVQSTPLVSRDGILLGMVSTHFRTAGRPDDRALGLLDLLARQAADIIERASAEEALRTAYTEVTAKEQELRTANEELNRREKDLSIALAEKEALLSEIHHRVKNNLASFISLLALDGSYDKTPQGIAMRNDLQNRARSMSLIHDILYKTHNFSTVDMQLYLSTLVQQVVGSYRLDQDVGYTVETHDQTLDLQRATPVGLIVNELVTNSLKYAFPAGPGPGSLPDSACLISISLEREDGMYLLTIRDNGVGLPTGFDPHVSKSLGLKLVNFLARHQLRGTVAFDSGSIGLQCRITFPEKN